MDTLTPVIHSSRQDFDVLAMLALMKDLKPSECATITAMLQSGNAAILSAIQCNDKAALLAAAGIERAINDIRHDMSHELCETSRGLSKDINDSRYDVSRDVNAAARDIVSNVTAGLNHVSDRLGSSLDKLSCRVDSGFNLVGKELCDTRVQILTQGYEAQLREKDNLFKILESQRDGKDATREEGRLTREVLRQDKIDDLREDNLKLANKYAELKSDFRELGRRTEEREYDRQYTREQIRDAVSCMDHHDHVPYFYEGDHYYGGCGRGRRHHGYPYGFDDGCSPRRDTININLHNRRNRRDHDDNGHGNDNGNGNGNGHGND